MARDLASSSSERIMRLSATMRSGEKEHVFGAGQTNTFGAETEGGLRRFDRFHIGAHGNLAAGVRPAQQGADGATNLRLGQWQRAEIDRAVRAIDGQPVTGVEFALANAADHFERVRR